MSDHDIWKPRFESNEEALVQFAMDYEALGAQYGLTGDELWEQAESASISTDDYRKITALARSIGMLKYLIEREKNG